MNHSFPSPISLSRVRAEGELGAMIQTLFSRLHEPLYRYDEVIRCDTHTECPGDWYGRIILALTMLSQVTGQEAQHLRELARNLPKQINGKGYFGPVVADMEYDEGAAAHNFLLRGLCEYHLWKEAPEMLAMARRMAESVFVPLAAVVRTYPDEEQRRVMNAPDAVIGTYAGNVGRWRLSSDTGSLFGALDGLSQVAQLTGSKELGKAIDAMLARYEKIDVVRLQAQTHSTLTTARALVRLFVHRQDPRYLQMAREHYQLYKQHAWTEDYQNYNWFGRPLWTEGCTIVDSLILAGQLWQFTGEAGFLDDFHLIFYNGLRHNQFPNGGFGVATCLGTGGNIFHLKQIEDMAEATWCCTMHGANGLAWAAQSTYFLDGNRIVVPHYTPSTAELHFRAGDLTLKQTTEYPYAGKVRLDVTRSTSAGEKQLRFFIPSWVRADALQLSLNQKQAPGEVNGSFVTLATALKEGDVIELTFELRLRKETLLVPERAPGYCRYFHGPVMLGCVTDDEVVIDPQDEWAYRGQGVYEIIAKKVTLAPLSFQSYKSMDEARRMKVQFLFRDGRERSEVRR